MGHYAAEIGYQTPKERMKFETDLLNYRRRCSAELREVLDSNPIDIRDIQVGNKLTLFNKLYLESRVKLDPSDEPHIIREAFCNHDSWAIPLWSFAYSNHFEVYQKDEEKKVIVIHPDLSKYCILWDGPDWISIKFFEKARGN